MTGQDVWSLLSTQVTSAQGENTSTTSRRRRSSTNNSNQAAIEKAEGGGAEGNNKKPSRGDIDDAGAMEAEGEGTAATTPAAVRAFSSFALCVGMPGAGKSSLLNTYLNPNNDGVPKPTVALEYMFARRTSMANAPKVMLCAIGLDQHTRSTGTTLRTGTVQSNEICSSV